MVLLSPFRNGIKRGDQWTLKSLFNNVLFLMDDIHSFSESSELLSFHPCFSVCDLSQLPLSFISFLRQKALQLIFMGGFVHVSMYACRYVFMQLYLHCQHLRIHFLMMRHSSYTKNISIQFPKKYTFLWNMGNLDAVCTKIMQPYIS